MGASQGRTLLLSEASLLSERCRSAGRALEEQARFWKRGYSTGSPARILVFHAFLNGIIPLTHGLFG